MRLRPAVAVLVVLLAGSACGDQGQGAGVVGRAAGTPPPPGLLPAPPAPGGDGTPRALVTSAGIVVPVVSPAGDGWTVRTPCNATATLTGSQARSAGSPVVVLDPGHGGAQPGAISPAGLTEAAVNLAVAREAQAALAAAGVPALLTRTGDYDLSLATRSEIARAVAPRAFVSIHHNADPDGPRAGPGSETYYQVGSAGSKRLAGLVYEEVVRALSAYAAAWVADRDAGAKYRTGSQGDYYAVLRQSPDVVSVLAELAFVTNPSEADLLARPDVQRAEGQAVARGIVRYLTTRDPGSGFVDPYPRTDPPPAAGPPPACHDPRL